MFLQLLDDRGWVTYTDEVIGWSVRHPSDWVVIEQTPGDKLILATPKQQGLFLLSSALDADDVDESSGDYLRGGVGFSVADGLLREPEEDAWFWYDHDFDGEHGVLDIDGVATSLAVDLDGTPLSADEKSPVWWFGYYDPDSFPGYGYIMQTIGLDPVLFQWLDDIVLSFEPPAG